LFCSELVFLLAVLSGQVEAVKAAYDESGAAQYKKSAGKAVAAVRGALSEEVDANAGSVRKALSILGLISAPPAWTEEQVHPGSPC
jgi:hypothetical protein